MDFFLIFSLERCKSWDPTWKEKPGKTHQKVQTTNCTLVGSADGKREKLVQQNIMPAHKHAAEQGRQATRTTKRRRRKCEQSWTAAAPREGAALAKTRKETFMAKYTICIPCHLRAIQVK